MVTLTETTDIDLDALKHQLFTFYLAVPSRSRDSKLIGSLMVNFLLDHVLEIREQMKYPLTMLLDEFTNFGKISGIGDTLSIIRKNKIGLDSRLSKLLPARAGLQQARSSDHHRHASDSGLFQAKNISRKRAT